MKTFVLLAALAGLLACSQETAQPAAEATASAAPGQPALTIAEAVGTYDYTLADGSDGTTVLASDGTFTDAMGGETITGSWEVADGKLCLDPTGDGADERRRCYSLGEPHASGLQIATSDTGEPIKVSKRPG